ncbi:rhombosortase [Synoicihabitans lomoniglobus]|uniref:Rhombosortase n=1 Tax=Synoicihabitans lomoniglobus TaxID=2909285 RepID=A0AAF0CP27_9BACT|nr:rhombosortase [Opitutaceae bacterium LMO-M01]WED63274.1 rhombosortase [Opitutaceae bacterium LMO-M01]
MKRFPFLTFGLAFTAVLIALIPGATAWLQLDRYAVIHDVQWLRGLTGHLTHFDTDHLTWDVAALLLLGTLAERESRRATAVTLALSAIGISSAVLIFHPQFATYRGLSGLDSALFGLIVARLFTTGWRERHGFTLATAALAAVGFIFKTGFELFANDTVFASSLGYAPVPLAHFVGFTIGSIVATFSARNAIRHNPHPSLNHHGQPALIPCSNPLSS